MRNVGILFMSTHHVHGIRRIVVRSDSDQGWIVEHFKVAQEARTNGKVMDDQVEFKVLWVVLEEVEAPGCDHTWKRRVKYLRMSFITNKIDLTFAPENSKVVKVFNACQ